MIKFYDPSGESHFGQATITRTTSVNGGLSLTGEVFAGNDVLNGLDYGWWLNFDNEKYVITYKKLSDDTNTIVFDAVQQFFWDFAKVALHSQYSGSHEYTFYLNQLFSGSKYTYKNDATVPAFEKESWGYKNKLSLFNDIVDQAAVEFEVHNETIHIAKQIGSDLTSFVRKGINLSDLTEEMKISDFATYAKGYGAFKDQQDPSQGRLEVEYRSELAKQFGDLEADPIVDERYTIASNLIAELKKKIDATYTVSMTMNIYDLENAGYPNYESPKVGDWILAIDEALNFKRKIRIIKLEEQFDVTGKRIGYTATCGDLNIVDQYTNIQSSLDSRVQRIQESINSVASSADGKNTNYYSAKEPVSANDGDLWFDQSNSDPDKWSIKQWANGRWEQLTLNPGEVAEKVEVVREEAKTAVNNAKSASDKADQLASKYDDTNLLASQAFSAADSAYDYANSEMAVQSNATAKAQNAADSAFSQAKTAIDTGQAASQAVTDLKDGSTLTIAELGSGLASKVSNSEYATYKTQTASQVAQMVTSGAFSAYSQATAELISEKVTTKDFSAYQDTTAKAIESKVESSDFKSYKEQTADMFVSKISFNNLTISNRNLALGTATPFTMTGNGSIDNSNNLYSTSRTISRGTTITASFDITSTNSTGIYNIQFRNGEWQNVIGANHGLPLASGTQHHSYTFTTTDDFSNGLLLRLDNATGTVTISNFIISESSKEVSWTPAPEDLATVTALSSISQTIDAIQTTVRGKVDNDVYQSKVVQLSNQLTSVVGQVNTLGQRNLVANSQFQYDKFDGSTWTSDKADNWYSSDYAWSWWNGYQGICCNIPITDPVNTNQWNSIVSKKIYVPDTASVYSGSAIFNIEKIGGRTQMVLDWYDQSMKRIGYATKGVTVFGTQTLVKIENQTPPEGTAYVALHVDVNGGGHLAVIAPMLVNAASVGSYVPDNASWTEFQQTASDINLKVSKDGVINAINVSNEGTSIYGNKLHITADTYIDNAIIKSAMIESLEADKIRTGTLDADKVNVIHLNASNITAGVINGPNLAIDLNTGEILFQKGAIRSTNGNLNIDIDSGNMAVTNSNGDGFRFQDGNLYLARNSWSDIFHEKPDYGYIVARPNLLSNVKGMQIDGTQGIALTTGGYDASTISVFQHQPSGAGLTLHDNTAFLNSHDITRIEGGNTYTEVSGWDNGSRATIIVGGANGVLNMNPTGNYGHYNFQEPTDVGNDLFMKGQEITIQGGTGIEVADLNFRTDGKGAVISSAAIYNRTYSSGDKVTITGYGTLGRITSARKYKIADTPSLDVISKAKRVLDIKPAEWYDKAEMESIADAKTNGTEAPGEAKIEKHYGFIADDFDEAGLTEVVLYRNGEVDSLDYDRISMYHNVILTDHEKRIAELEAELKQLKGEI